MRFYKTAQNDQPDWRDKISSMLTDLGFSTKKQIDPFSPSNTPIFCLVAKLSKYPELSIRIYSNIREIDLPDHPQKNIDRKSFAVAVSWEGGRLKYDEWFTINNDAGFSHNFLNNILMYVLKKKYESES